MSTRPRRGRVDTKFTRVRRRRTTCTDLISPRQYGQTASCSRSYSASLATAFGWRIGETGGSLVIRKGHRSHGTEGLVPERPAVDSAGRNRHPVLVLPFGRRITAAAVLVGLSIGRVGLCAGWEPTPQARMACCTEGDDCPMHQPAVGSTTTVTQAEADRCCSAADRGDTTPSTSRFVAVVSLEPVVSPISLVALPAGTPFDTWRTLVPPLASQVPTHLLLSVFLI